MTKRIIPALAALCLAAFPDFPATAEETRRVNLGAAAAVETHHALGGAACRQVNKGRRRHGVFCLVESADAPAGVIHAIRAGELEFGVVQAPLLDDAYRGVGQFEAYGQFKNLRAVFAAHPEAFTVLARPGAAIRSFADLRGKRVNLGAAGSSGRAAMESLMAAFGMRAGDLARAAELRGREIVRALCDGSLDAAAYSVGHPSGEVSAAVEMCGAALVEVAGEPAERFVAGRPYYRSAVIPGGMYSGNDRDIKTFSADAVVVTADEIPDQAVRIMARAVLNNIESVRELHPAFEHLRPEEMSAAKTPAPPHPAAENFFREKGWR